jgi:hypothetical protein
VVKGIYLTAWSAGRPNKMDNVLAMLDKTELNSVVIDIRDSGIMYWKTGIPIADASGATKVAVADPEGLFESLEKHKVWPIARIACFRDQFVPKAMPERGVRTASGGIWRDRSGHSWLDPYNRKNWEYIAETVDFAMDAGFQDVQLDYVRFPSEGNSRNQRFPAKKAYPNPQAAPDEVIHDFASFIRDRVKKRGLAISADVFGIISSGKGDQGIGQKLEKVAAPFDVISPMVYPSHYARGEYGIANPNAQPYAIIKASLADYKKRLPDAQVRPWLQDFSLGHRYGVKEVQAQIKAVRDLGYREFLLWNAGNRYTWAALGKDERLKPPAKSAQTSGGKTSRMASTKALPVTVSGKR